VHGNLPLSYLTGKDKDNDEYVQQMHVISFVESKAKGKFDDFTLYSGKEKDPYMITALLPEVDGSIALRGSVKNQFESQWMMNHTVKSIKDHLDLANKLIFQTSDGNFVGQNALSSIESGDILIHALNQPLTQLNNSSHDIVQEQNFGQMWKMLGNEINGISDAMLGEVKSGTAWRQTEAQLAESHNLFDLMTANRGIDVKTMLRRFVIPHIKKKIDTSEEISALLSDYGIDKIDAMWVKKEATKKMIDKDIKDILNDKTPAQDMAGATQQVKDSQAHLGAQRFFKPSDIESVTWKELMKDLEWEIEIDVTEDDIDKDALTTLNTVLTIVSDPIRSQALNTPKGKFVFNKILELTGAASPIELSDLPDAPPMQPQVQPTASAPNGGSPVPVSGGLPVTTQ
jgi:hypothetical protein